MSRFFHVLLKTYFKGKVIHSKTTIAKLEYIDQKTTHCIQGVTEISALILTGNRTHRKEQLFSLPFWRKTLRNGLKKYERFS
jgi:hypothetical protein